MKVYIVLLHEEFEDDTPQSTIIGAYDSFEKAKEELIKQHDFVIDKWEGFIEDWENGVEDEIYDDHWSLFNTENNRDFVVGSINETEVK